MKILKTNFKGLFIINCFDNCDPRGSFTEIYRKSLIDKNMLDYEVNFCQLNIVKSRKMVFRGLHFQKPPHEQSKLVSVLKGKILDIAVDIRPKSKTYGKYFSIEISDDDNKSLFIPKGFAHGYLTLTDDVIISYSVDQYYNKKSEDGISFKDKKLNIEFGFDKNQLVLSNKDLKLKDFNW